MKRQNTPIKDFLNAYQNDDPGPTVEYEGEQISFPNHIMSGYITNETNKRLVIVRTADHDLARIERRQKLEQFYLVATLNLITNEQTVYDVSTDIECIRDPSKQRVATYLGAVAVRLRQNDEPAATLIMESHRIDWVEPHQVCSFEQLS